jgi:hypothetical protein
MMMTLNSNFNKVSTRPGETEHKSGSTPGRTDSCATLTSMAQLFGDERCTAAILDFLRTTDVGVRRGKERRLEVGEDDGEDGGAEWTEDEAQSEWSEDEGG